MSDLNHTLLESIEAFLTDYYREDIARIAQEPNDRQSLWIDFDDLWSFDSALADDLRERPDGVLEHIQEAIPMVDVPLPDTPEDVTVRVTGIPPEHTHAPGELRSDHGGRYVGVTGVLDRVTATSDLPDVVAFSCQRHKGETGIVRVPQDPTDDEIREPHECPACERQGPFTIDDGRSEWSDYAKVRIQGQPSGDGDGSVEGYVLDDLIDEGGEDGLMGRVGEPVTVYGIVRREQQSGRGEKQLLFDHNLEVRAVEFDRDDETVSIEDHRDTFEELAARPDAVDIFAESIAPQLHTTDAWDAAMEFAVAYLFGAPRIDVAQGPTYRGDLHFLIVSDYGMGKSTFKEEVEAYSPKCISKSTTALSSGVGLTAAAVKDDFGDGQWTIKPGLLVRANGGHLILDEIDKGPDELTNMNDALEGEQVVDIEKAGQSATYESRTAVMALGNPVEGRFNAHEPIAEQLGISESLLSRFDGIVTMQDDADEAQDSAVAETYGRAYTEAQAAQYGDSDDMDTLERPVSIAVGQAWIQHARETVTPILSYEQFKTLETWYAEEVRQLNETYAGEGEGGDMPVPATVRELGTAVKLAIAFARVHLRDHVTDADVERAKKLGKRLVKQHWNGEQFDATKNVSSKTQQSRDDIVRQIIANQGGADIETIREQAASRDLDPDRAEQATRKLAQQGAIFEPENGVFDTV
jgi:replicative DNA helicase Mcm